MMLARFNEIWSTPDYPPQPVAVVDLEVAEQRLGVRLPEGYRRGVLEVGLPCPTLALLDAIIVREFDMPPIGDFYTPAEIVEETLAWREIGMPPQLVAIASDGCGNKFCLDADRLSSNFDSEAIWFFDHDFGTVSRVADSFETWIESYCGLEPVDEPDWL